MINRYILALFVCTALLFFVFEGYQRQLKNEYTKGYNAAKSDFRIQMIEIESQLVQEKQRREELIVQNRTISDDNDLRLNAILEDAENQIKANEREWYDKLIKARRQSSETVCDCANSELPSYLRVCESASSTGIRTRGDGSDCSTSTD
jgi:hypothetical protein